VYLIFPMRSSGWEKTSSANAMAICLLCNEEHNRRKMRTVPHAHLPAVHYAMGGIWVELTTLMSTVPGLFVLGEPTFPITERTASAPVR